MRLAHLSKGAAKPLSDSSDANSKSDISENGIPWKNADRPGDQKLAGEEAMAIVPVSSANPNPSHVCPRRQDSTAGP